MEQALSETIVRIDRAACTIEARNLRGQASSISLACIESMMTQGDFAHIFCHSGAQYHLPISSWEMVHEAWVEYLAGDMTPSEVLWGFSVGDQQYGMEEFSDLRGEIIKLRDAALADAKMGDAVKLSHAIGAMYELADKAWGAAWREFRLK